MPEKSSYYVVGGTLRSDAACYVERPADHQLFDCLIRGEFCYVLTSRQMGKSSLMVRTASRLRASGHRVVTLDLTALGQNLTVEQWYGGLLRLMGEQLRLEDELEDFWLAHRHLGPLQRWMCALREIVLPARSLETGVPAPLIIFLDEIDAVRGLSFCTDEFFAAIRECYNARSAHDGIQCLRFCLIGVATPTDLIREAQSTPFNIGQRIDLDDFAPEEALPLAQGLEPAAGAVGARSLLRRVLYWTAGHPYMTQRLCQTLADGKARSAAEVDRQCGELFLSKTARQRDDNLQFVRQRLLRGENRGGVLALYERLLGPFPARVADDETDERVTEMRLAGVVKGREGRLRLRNRIYRQVFDRAWVIQHKPEQEVRRQRAAFRRGVFRTAAVAAVVVAVLAGATGSAYSSERRAAKTARELREALGAKEIALRNETALTEAWKEAVGREEAARISATLAREEEQGQRRVAQREAREAKSSRQALHRNLHRLTVEEGARRAAGGDMGGALLWYAEGMRYVSADPISRMHQQMRIAFALDQAPRLAAAWPRGNVTQVFPVQSGERGLFWTVRGSVELRDLRTGRALFPPLEQHAASLIVSDHCRVLLTVNEENSVRRFDLSTGRPLGKPLPHPEELSAVALSRDGRRLVCGGIHGGLWLYNLEAGTTAFRRDPSRIYCAAFAPDGRLLTVSDTMRFRDPESGVSTGPEFERMGGWERLHQLHFTADGERLAALRGGAIQVWDPKTGRWLRELPDGSHPVFAIEGSRMLLTGRSSLRVWDLNALRPVGPYIHAGEVAHATLSADGVRIESVTGEGTHAVWDAETGERLSTRRLGSAVMGAMLLPGGERVLTVSPTSIQVWAGAAPTAPSTLGRFATESKAAPLLDASGRFAWYGSHGRLRAADLKTGKTRELPQPSRVTAFALAGDGRTLVTAGEDRRLRRWSLPGFRRLPGETGIPLKANGLELSRDGSVLAVRLENYRGLILDVSRRRWLTPAAYGGPLLGVSPDGRFALAGGASRQRVWRRQGARFVPHMQTSHGGLQAWAFSPQSNRLATGHWEGGVRLWNLESRAFETVHGHGAAVRALAFSRDASRLLSGCTDATARLWDGRTLDPLGPPLLHDAEVMGVAFSRDSLIATVTSPGEVRTWDIRSGQLVSGPYRLAVGGALRFDPRGRALLLSGLDGVHRIALRADPTPLNRLRELAEVLAQRRLGPAMSENPLEAARLVPALRRHAGLLPDSKSATPAPPTQLDRLARDAETRREWAIARGHLDALLRAAPGTLSVRRRRAWVLAELGLWREAAGDYARLREGGVRDYLLFYHLAVTQLAGGDRPGYRRTCAEMIEYLEGGTAREREMTAWTCVLGPEALPDSGRALRLIDGLLREQPGHPDYLDSRVALLYRAGRYSEALETYAQLLERGRLVEQPTKHLLLALLHRARGDRAEYARRLALAEEGARPMFGRDLRDGQHWDEIAEYSLLLHELQGTGPLLPRRPPPERATRR